MNWLGLTSRRLVRTLVLLIMFLILEIGTLGHRLAAEALDPEFTDERLLHDFRSGLDKTPVLAAVTTDWDGQPLQFRMAVAIERQLTIDQPFQLALETAVDPHFRVEHYDDFVLLTPDRALSTRARIRLADGRTIPMDIHVLSGGGPAGALQVRTRIPDPDTAPAEPPTTLTSVHLPPAPSYPSLVRFAAQQIFAPERYRENWPGLQTQPVRRKPVRLLRGVQVLTTPVTSWHQGGLYVTLVEVQSRHKHQSIRLDPRNLTGYFRAAAFQHQLLRPGEWTMLYLISDRPFGETLGVQTTVVPFSETEYRTLESQ